jgi:hypothetical protein
MHAKKLLTILAAAVLSLALATGAAGQAPPKEGASKPQGRQPLQSITVEGKVKLRADKGGYYIRGKVEVFRITNPHDKVLAALAQSGKSVTIVAKPHGDYLEIITIDGKPYPGVEKPKAQ